MAMALNKEVIALTKTVDPELLRRAVSYLHTKETRSTFEIEGETATPKHEQRFVAALSEACKIRLVRQSHACGASERIVEPRYAAKDCARTFKTMSARPPKGSAKSSI
jgi:hypothetical protein